MLSLGDLVSLGLLLLGGGASLAVSLCLFALPRGIGEKTMRRILGACFALLACSFVSRAFGALLPLETDLGIKDTFFRVHYLALVLGALHLSATSRMFAPSGRWFDLPSFLLFALFVPFAFTPAFVSTVIEPDKDPLMMWDFWLVIILGEMSASFSIARLWLAIRRSASGWVDHSAGMVTLAICLFLALPIQAFVDAGILHISSASLPSAAISIASALAGIWIVWVFPYRESKMVAMLHADLERVTASALRDPLTGLYNRAYLFEALHQALERLRRDKEPFAIMMVDLDKFKEINDRMGHIYGDKVLQSLAKVLLKCARPYDIVARYGGDEFMLLLQDVDENEAKQIAERIRRAVQDAKPVEADTVTTVTATIGIAHVKTPPESLSHLIERVDNAMYDGKRQGRNRIILA